MSNQTKTIHRALDLSSAAACGVAAFWTISFGIFFRAPLPIAIGGVGAAASAYMAWSGISPEDNSLEADKASS